MPNVAPLFRSLKRLARDQQRVIAQLQRLLPILNGTPKAAIAAKAPKRLRCPRCDRRFAHPMNLGRHLQATHGRKMARKAA